MIFLYCTTLTLIYDVLFSFKLYYIQLKEVKILCGSGAGGRRLGNPNTLFYRICSIFLNTYAGNYQTVFSCQEKFYNTTRFGLISRPSSFDVLNNLLLVIEP